MADVDRRGLPGWLRWLAPWKRDAAVALDPAPRVEPTLGPLLAGSGVAADVEAEALGAIQDGLRFAAAPGAQLDPARFIVATLAARGLLGKAAPVDQPRASLVAMVDGVALTDVELEDLVTFRGQVLELAQRAASLPRMPTPLPVQAVLADLMAFRPAA